MTISPNRIPTSPTHSLSRRAVACLLVSTALISCTQPKETTGIGAAAGGALGAGLGAIIGSQTGAAGGGLVIGAVAGSAGGALVGNALQAQQESVRSQDEALERQDRMIRAQRSEIDELRRMNQDQPSRRVAINRPRTTPPSSSVSRTSPPSKTGRDIPSSLTDTTRLESEPRARLQPAKSSLSERDIDSPSMKAKRTLGDFEESSPLSSDRSSTALVPSQDLSPSQDNGASSCGEAQGEAKAARIATESSDKLFHLRRALRLCPRNAGYHHDLGNVYLALSRPSDAEFEFKQALEIDPDFSPAQASLAGIKRGSKERF